MTRLILRVVLAVIPLCLMSVWMAAGVGKSIHTDQLAYLAGGFQGTIYTSDIYLTDINRWLVLNLTRNRETVWLNALAWSPDGKALAYHTRRLPTAFGGFIHVIHLPDRSEFSLTTDSTDEQQLPPRWSPDGTQIAFARLESNQWALYHADLTQQPINYERLDTSGMEPQWSPDGTQIAYMRRERRARIRVIDLKTHQSQTLSTSVFVFGIAGWSADGKHLIFTGGNGSRLDLYRIAVASGDEEQLTRSAFPTAAVNSPDGTWTAYSIAPNPSVGVFALHLATGKLSQVNANVDAAAPSLNWSPDSRRLAYRVDQQIAVINLDGSGKITLTRGEMLNAAPAWRP